LDVDFVSKRKGENYPCLPSPHEKKTRMMGLIAKSIQIA